MKEVWALGASKSFMQFVKKATGKKLTAAAYLKEVRKTSVQQVKEAKKRLQKQPEVAVSLDTQASIKLVHGRKTIATNKNSDGAMIERYARWLKKLKVK